MDDSSISRQAAIKSMAKAIWHYPNELYTGLNSYEACEALAKYGLMNVPPSEAEPERKKGEWIYGENDGQDGWFCSECGFFIPWYYEYYGLDNIDFISDYRTCPKCDANMIKYTGMRGEQDGTEK